MQRLKTRQQFQAVMDGTVVSRTPHFALHRLALQAPAATPVVPADAVSLPGAPDASAAPTAAPLFPGDSACWIGALVPKRWAKRAVTRNAIKRQIYTVSAVHEARLPVAAHVVRLRAGFDRKQFPSATSEALKQTVRAELEQLLARAFAKPATLPGASTAAPRAAKAVA
ncbi:MAG: ribonuclease P protein component [Rubrivivax sp.]|nr:MAG: ribonuclease P protein component [Rubrivivax sp.]